MNLLFDHGAKINMKTFSFKNPLKESSRCGHKDCIRILIDRGVRQIVSLDQRDYSPLMMVIKNKDLHEFVPVLLENGESVNTMTKSGICPLFLACRMRSYEIVSMLCSDPTLKLNITGQGDVLLVKIFLIQRQFIGLLFLVFLKLSN